MRRVVAVLLIVCMAGPAAGFAWGQTPAPADSPDAKPYVPPQRGAPSGRTGGASRDIEPIENPANAPVRQDAVLWQSIQNSRNPADFEAFLMRYPNSDFASAAERRLATLRAQPGR
jgi:hypothetical protein